MNNYYSESLLCQIFVEAIFFNYPEQVKHFDLADSCRYLNESICEPRLKQRIMQSG